MRRPKQGTALVNTIMQYLSRRGLKPWRNNTGAVRMPSGRFVRFGVKGGTDVFCLLPPGGRLLAVECKDGGGRPTPEQKAFIDNVNRAGGLAFVARCLEDVQREVDPLLDEV